MGQAKAGFKFSFKSLSFKERDTFKDTFKPSAQSPLRECHYPDMKGVDNKEKKSGLAMRMGG